MNRTLEVEDLKRTTRILDVLARYGIEAKPQGRGYMARCPFHEDGTPSLSVDPVKNVWHCFGCDAGGSVIDFVMKKDGLDFRAATQRLIVEQSGGQVRRASDFAASQPAKSYGIDPKLIESVIEHYHKTLCGDDRRGLDYLKRRGLADPETLKTFRTGYVNGSMKLVLPASAVEPLQRLGILNEKGNEFFYGCVVVPVFCAGGASASGGTVTGELGEMYGRSIEGSRHLYLPGTHRGVLNAKAAEVFDDVILTEAVLDALSLYAIGVQNVIPCYGTGGFTADHAEALRKTRRVFLAFDNDEAGENGAKKLAATLSAQGVECHRVHLPALDGAVKDLNDYTRHLRGQGMTVEEVKAAFAELMKHAPRVGFTRPAAAGKAGTLNLVEQTETALVFRNCDALYHLRGLYDNNGTSLRVILTARREDAAHTDRLDLYAAKSRAGFAYRAAHRLEIPAAKIEEDLSRLIPVLETLLAETKGRGEDASPKIPEMSEAQRRDALALLRAPDLLAKIAAHLETVGYVGEERNKQLGYLIATSRKLSKPLSAIIRSESGAGKSFLMESVAELMPPEDVKYFSRLTPQSLYYMGKDELVHKLLIVDERDGSQESDYPIRNLQTRRKLTLAVPVKDPAGRIKTKVLEILGPIAYMESSTSPTINPENLNRCFELYLDNSKEQTERIMAAQRRTRTLAGLAHDTRRDAAVRLHHNAQRLLRPLKVVAHFAEHLRFPAQWLRTRRDNERFLSLLEIVTFLHQHQRPAKTSPDGVEHVETTLADYRMAYDLARTIFTQTLQDVSKPAKDLLEQIREMVRQETARLHIEAKDYWFTRRTVREHTRLPDYTIKRVIRELEDLEYLDVKRSGQGGSFRYRLATQHVALSNLDGLTTPEELAEKWDKWNTTGTTAKNEEKARE
jgi:DNA primase catalytic core